MAIISNTTNAVNTSVITLMQPTQDSLPSILGSEYWLAALIYIVCCLVVLWLWSTITRRMSKPIGGMLWIAMLAILFTPVMVDGPHPQLAPAIIGAIFALLSSDNTRLMSSIFPMTLVMGIGFLFGFLYEQIKSKIE